MDKRISEAEYRLWSAKEDMKDALDAGKYESANFYNSRRLAADRALYRRKKTMARRRGNRKVVVVKNKAPYRRKSSSFGINKYMPFWAGAAIGYSNLDDKIPAQYTLLAATAPVRGGGVGQIKAVAQGIVFGNIVQNLMAGKTLIGGSSSNSGFGI